MLSLVIIVLTKRHTQNATRLDRLKHFWVQTKISPHNLKNVWVHISIRTTA